MAKHKKGQQRMTSWSMCPIERSKGQVTIERSQAFPQKCKMTQLRTRLPWNHWKRQVEGFEDQRFVFSLTTRIKVPAFLLCLDRSIYTIKLPRLRIKTITIISNFLSFSCAYFLPCLCVPVKMSVGTETEKFWDSLWELQAECTGLLWVERHPWARGDLGQSPQRERERERKRKTQGRFGHKQWETSQSECRQRGRKRRTQQPTQHNIAVEWKRRQKGKEQQKEGFFFFLSPTFCSIIPLKSRDSSGKLVHSSQLKISVSHIQSRDANTTEKNKCPQIS